MNLGELKKVLEGVKAANVRFGGFCEEYCLLPEQYQLGISESGKTICILDSPDVNGIEGEVYDQTTMLSEIMSLPESYNDLDIIYNLASEIPEFSQLPVSAGDCVTGLIHRLYQDEYKPFKGVNVDEFDNSGKIVNHTLTDENGYYSISIINPADSILIHADGYEPMKFEIFRTDGQIAGFILDETDEVSLIVSDAPEFPGGRQALQKFITSNMEYPSDALRDSIKGRVLVQFTVEKDGSITDIEVLKHVHPLLDKEAVRIVSGMPRWIPGKHFGFPRRVRYTIPVTFRLDNSTKPGPAVTDNDRVEEDILADPNDKTF